MRFKQIIEIANQQKTFFFWYFLVIPDSGFKECFWGYQQVIHNKNMLAGVVFELVITPKNNMIEAVGLYKCLYIQVISRIANGWKFWCIGQ